MNINYYQLYSKLPITNAPRAWVEVDLEAIRHNYRIISSEIRARRGDCRFIAVVKADCYGHGIPAVVRALLDEGCSSFALACAEEAITVRQTCREVGADADILVLGVSDPSLTPLLYEYELIQTVHSAEYAAILSKNALSAGGRIKIHIKLDTGLNRLGFPTFTDEDEACTVRQIRQISELGGLKIDGIYSHFACADGTEEHERYRTALQSERFFGTVEKIRAASVELPTVHICNSPGSFVRPGDLADAARIGISIFGVDPAPEYHFDLLPTIKLCASICKTGTVYAGEEVSYGGEFRAEHDMRSATVSIGYADGVFRRAGGYEVKIFSRDGKYKGKSTIIGRVCMDMCMLDLGTTNAEVGDTVVFYGTEKEDLERFAAHCNMIPHECLVLISARIPRLICGEDKK